KKKRKTASRKRKPKNEDIAIPTRFSSRKRKSMNYTEVASPSGSEEEDESQQESSGESEVVKLPSRNLDDLKTGIEKILSHKETPSDDSSSPGAVVVKYLVKWK